MPLWSRLRSFSRNWLSLAREEDSLERELEAYVELLTDERANGEASRQEARRDVLAAMGGKESVKESVRARRARRCSRSGHSFRLAALLPESRRWGWTAESSSSRSGRLSSHRPRLPSCPERVFRKRGRSGCSRAQDARSPEPSAIAGDAAVAPERYGPALIGAFGLSGLLLALVGVYGVLSHAASSRRQEFGLRIALGARGLEVGRLVLAQGARLLALGVVLGLLTALGLSRSLASQLYGVRSTDPETYGVVLVGLLACAVPAAWMDPMKNLRDET